MGSPYRHFTRPGVRSHAPGGERIAAVVGSTPAQPCTIAVSGPTVSLRQAPRPDGLCNAFEPPVVMTKRAFMQLVRLTPRFVDEPEKQERLDELSFLQYALDNLRTAGGSGTALVAKGGLGSPNLGAVVERFVPLWRTNFPQLQGCVIPQSSHGSRRRVFAARNRVARVVRHLYRHGVDSSTVTGVRQWWIAPITWHRCGREKKDGGVGKAEYAWATAPEQDGEPLCAGDVSNRITHQMFEIFFPEGGKLVPVIRGGGFRPLSHGVLLWTHALVPLATRRP